MSDQPTSHSPLAAVSRIRFFAIVTLPAAVLMALEMVSSRLLAPEFGNSVYVWGSIIGVFLATMSAGYWFGGRLADQHPNLVTLGGVLLASGCFQALVLIFGRPATAWLGAVTGGSPEGVLVATFVLFGAPTVFLAMVSPFVVKIAADDLDALGGTAGQLYALSTGGSLVGTLGATFVLIPRMGLEPIFALLLAATAVSAFLCLGPAWRTQRLATVLGIALLALAVIPDDLFRTTDLQVVAERLSPYQTLRVVETGDMRYLYSDGALHASVDKRDGSSTMVYSKIAAAGLLLQPETKRLAVLGMGGGNVGRHLSDLVPSLEVDYVDVDPAIPELAETYLGFVPGPRHRVHVADARRFLVDRPADRWEYIYADTYIGSSIPFHLSTVEFFHAVRAHLAPGGVFGMNMIGDLASPLQRSVLRSLAATFSHVYIFRVPGGNHLFLATDSDSRRQLADLEGVARRLAADSSPEPSWSEIARLLRPVDLDVGDALLLTDEFAPVNNLLHQGTEQLEESAKLP